MTSTVTCGYSGAAWEINSAGQDACQQYAALVGTCSSTFIVGPVTPSSPPYIPTAATASCACNVVAYNLQAACGWCQDAIQPSWWALQSQWAGNCTLLSTAYNPSGLPASVSTASLTIPVWATATVNSIDDTWNPATASSLAVAAVTTGAATTRTSGGGLTTGFGAATTTGRSYTTGYPYGDYGNVVAASAVSVGLVIGIVALIWVLHFAMVAVFYFCRQKRRQAWYRPMGQFYREQGAGAGHLAAAPLLFHNEANVHGSPHTHASSLPVGTSPSPSNAYTAYQPPPPSNIPLGGGGGGAPYGAPYGTPYDNRQSYASPPAAGNYGHEYPPHGGPPGGPPGTNPFNTPYSTPGGPPPGAGGAAGYTGHAEVY